MSRLFILGAGFSESAGVPMTGQLLAEAMRAFKAECRWLYDRVEALVRTCFGLDEEPCYESLGLSEICTFLHYRELREHGGGERWTDTGSRENLALRHYLAKTIVRLTPESGQIPDLYIRFGNQLRSTDIVITFNWDCVLEVALDQLGRPYSYTFEEGALNIAKLHGSVNWRVGLSDCSALRWESLHLTNGQMGPEVYACRELQRQDAWAAWHGQPLGEVRPFLVLPGFGKAFDVRYLARLWYKPEFAFGIARDVFVIGLGLARDDFIVRSFFVDNVGYDRGRDTREPWRVIIVNPDPAARENYAFLVGTPGVEFLCERFNMSHLEFMEKTSVGEEASR